jgi:hypothetical protein
MVSSSLSVKVVEDEATLAHLTEQVNGAGSFVSGGHRLIKAFQLLRSANIAENDGNINRAPIERSHLLCELIILSELSGARTALNVRCCPYPSSTGYSFS